MTLNIELLTRTVQWAINEADRQRSKGRRITPDNTPEPIVVGENLLAPGLVWDQGVWANGDSLDTSRTWCGTSCCLAGNVAILDFYADRENGWATGRWDETLADHGDIETVVDHWASDTTDAYSIASYARERLGLDGDEANTLFGGANDIEQIIAIADALAVKHTGYRLSLDYRSLSEADIQGWRDEYADL